MRTKFLVLAILFSSSSFANDLLSMNIDQFYEIDENKKMYQLMLDSGRIDISREMFKENCFTQAKDEREVEYCKCSESEIERVDGKIIFYDSLLTYRSFKAKAEAKKNNDEDEYRRLKKLDKERTGLLKYLENTCGKI